MLSATQWIYLVSFTLYSLVDLRTRCVPAIEAFFIAAALLAAQMNPLNTILVVMAVAWGLRPWPNWIIWLLLLSPANWPVLLMGFGVRQSVVGKADLLAAGALACVFPWPALVLSFIGLELWRRWWVTRQSGPVPALPGMMLGLGVYVVLQSGIVMCIG